VARKGWRRKKDKKMGGLIPRKKERLNRGELQKSSEKEGAQRVFLTEKKGRELLDVVHRRNEEERQVGKKATERWRRGRNELKKPRGGRAA